MNDISHLLTIVDEYLRATKAKDVTVSFWVFNDSKKLSALRSGADITVGRYNAAIRWFSDHWPADAIWPADIVRPVAERAA